MTAARCALLTMLLVGINGCAVDTPVQRNQSVVRALDRSADKRAEPEPSPSVGDLPIRLVEHRSTASGFDSTEVDIVDVEVSHATSVTPTPTPGLTLQVLTATAIANSHAIEEAYAAAASAAGVRKQVGLPANPTIAYRAEEIGADGAAGLHNINLSQTFVRGDKLAWNRAVVDRDVQKLMWEAEAQRVRVTTDVAIRFYEALAARKQVELTGEFLRVVDEGVELANTRVTAGEGTRADLLQAEVLRAEVLLRKQRAEVAEATARNRLAILTGRPLDIGVELTGELIQRDKLPPQEVMLSALMGNSPEVLAAYSEVERARRHVSRQHVQPVPNLTGQLGVGQDFASDSTFANVGVSLPIPVRNKNQGNIAAAQADYCRATQKLARLKQHLADRLAATRRSYEQAQASAGVYREKISPRARESLDLIEQAYQLDEVDFLRVLTARRAAFDAEVALVTASAEVAKQKALLDGFLLTGSLAVSTEFVGDDSLRQSAIAPN